MHPRARAGRERPSASAIAWILEPLILASSGLHAARGGTAVSMVTDGVGTTLAST